MERFRQIQQAGAFLAVLSTANIAAADGKTLPIRLIPEYTPCEYQKQRYACFTDQQILDLYTLEIEAKSWYANWHYYNDISIAQVNQIRAVELQVEKMASMQQRTEDQAAELQRKLLTEIERKTELEYKLEHQPRWQLWVGGAAGIFGAGAFIAALIVR